MDMPEPNNLPPTETKLDLEQKRVFYSRVGILGVAGVFGLVAVLSIVGFFFNLTTQDPTTGRPVIAVGPMWMLGHVIRGVGLGLLAFQMVRI